MTFHAQHANDFSSASNIPGHEYAGILLIMLLAFETSRYGEVFDRARALAIQGGQEDKHPGHDNFIADWKLLLSSLLEWWAWMKQPQIDRRCVKRSVYATSYLLRLLKTVAPRHDGMKNNTVKTALGSSYGRARTSKTLVFPRFSTVHMPNPHTSQSPRRPSRTHRSVTKLTRFRLRTAMPRT